MMTTQVQKNKEKQRERDIKRKIILGNKKVLEFSIARLFRFNAVLLRELVVVSPPPPRRVRLARRVMLVVK